ncbi:MULTISPECIES: porin [Rubrivivax]|uniref:Porin n=1 Tax=Rubrivivax benzoatilyticus TaxID=316997 RepID=A0ABX0HZH2_9BURK|nr:MULTISPECIES: porin [Rubrivivax]MCD0417640.1 porin [Rubrivivax sp. JA1024]EGJ12307.1 gram-negative type outer membrane porin protein [Rubrivivax benzoatilyticus JA2 = ATCC BAA-35]MCC9645490.1 porin [Rubrivivax sp. JA1029]NHK99214.1 porin [Rubrivivax benzoatilyticus]NHL24923.1 porin [Rubrivivax benzoatilyticus]
MISKPRSLTALALAAAALFAGAAQAQDGSVQIYGTLDLSVDRINKSEGNVTGTVQGLAGANSVVSPEQKQTRLAPSMTRQSHLGVRGTEPLGGGWEAKFTLEGSVIADNGTMGNDGRMWGRQAWVALTTPVGEVRLGRQVSPMLAAYFLGTLDGIGGTDLFATGVALNNLQTYQDNVISYGVRQGAWAGRVSYSPNAGAAARISPVRSTATNTPTGTIPPSGSAPQLGQILGGLTAGAESDDGRGKTWGAMIAYLGDDLKAVAAYNRNDLSNVQLGLPFRVTPLSPDGFLPLFATEKFTSYMLAAKYKFAFGTELGGSYYQGQLDETGDTDPKMRVLAIAAKHTIGSLDLIGQVMQAKFTNFTKGKDTGFMLGADYNLSKRTAIFARAGQVKDDRGDISNGNPLLGGAGLAGGPVALLVPLGSTEVPLFSGAGMNIDAKTKMFGVGIRHSF